jgi:hypothetical protein
MNKLDPVSLATTFEMIPETKSLMHITVSTKTEEDVADWFGDSSQYHFTRVIARGIKKESDEQP